ncbi:MAG TPA: aldo/keto reductase [Alphaproteobacteria bacterium]|nr:aldo/keto reductase [Alphaproteobacteria bacterium]
MARRRLGKSDIEIEPLVLGTNVIGGTIDEARSFEVLDAFLAEGFSAIDTADSYTGGNSETIIGNWMKARGNRDKVLIFTKVGSNDGTGQRNSSAAWIAQAVENSLRRLQTDYIDLYQLHFPDGRTPQEETLGAFDRLIRDGKVRAIGCSNFTTALLAEALAISAQRGLARYETLQNEYNLYDRAKFEEVQALCVRENVSGLHYFSLARGFVSGKYRTAADAAKSPRGPAVVERYLNDKGYRILAALDAVSARTGAAPVEIALAWLNAQPGTGAPIASATSVEQVRQLARGARLTLAEADLRALTDAGK